MSLRKYLIPKRVNNDPCISTELTTLLPNPAVEDISEKNTVRSSC